MATGNTKVPSLPPLPTNIDPQLRNYLKSVDSHLRIKSGDAGNPKDRNLTLRDLEESGIVSSPNTVKDFSITAGDPTVKLVSPDQLITDQVGEENTSKKFSKTGIILASEFTTDKTLSTTIPIQRATDLPDTSASGGNTGTQWQNNFTKADLYDASISSWTLMEMSDLCDATFDFTTGVHSRGGKKPYLITISANKSGFAFENPSSGSSNATWQNATYPSWGEVITLLIHADDIDAIAGSGTTMRVIRKSIMTVIILIQH